MQKGLGMWLTSTYKHREKYGMHHFSELSSKAISSHVSWKKGKWHSCIQSIRESKNATTYSLFYSLLIQSNPYIMFAANLQPFWPSRPKTKGPLLFYFLRLYNFGFYEIFVESTSSELQHPWISKISCEPKKSRKNNFSGSILKYF